MDVCVFTQDSAFHAETVVAAFADSCLGEVGITINTGNEKGVGPC